MVACWSLAIAHVAAVRYQLHASRSRLVRWAAVEAVQRVPTTSSLGQRRDRIAARRGRNIGIVAAARELIELVFYGLRDHHTHRLNRPASAVAQPA
jgi:hypothetical protein